MEWCRRGPRLSAPTGRMATAVPKSEGCALPITRAGRAAYPPCDSYIPCSCSVAHVHVHVEHEGGCETAQQNMGHYAVMCVSFQVACLVARVSSPPPGCKCGTEGRSDARACGPAVARASHSGSVICRPVGSAVEGDRADVHVCNKFKLDDGRWRPQFQRNPYQSTIHVYVRC